MLFEEQWPFCKLGIPHSVCMNTLKCKVYGGGKKQYLMLCIQLSPTKQDELVIDNCMGKLIFQFSFQSFYISLHAVSHTHRFIIFLVDLDGLIALCGQQSTAAVVKGHGKDSSIAVKRPGLGRGLGPLEVKS